MSMSPVPPSHGGHLFEPVFGEVAAQGSVSPASNSGAPRRRFTGLIVTALGIVVVGAVCAGVQWASNVGYDDALVSFEDTVDDASAGRTQLQVALTALVEKTDAATTISGADTGNLMDAAARESFTTARTEATDTEAEASALAEEALPTADEKPAWAWELIGETAQLNEDRDEAAAALREFESSATDVTAAADAVDKTGAAAVTTAAAAAGAFEAAHVSARNVDIIALRHAAEGLSDASVVDDATGSEYLDLEGAAADMLTSEQAELAEKQGPLYDTRIEIEAFARGLAPGVLLDFDWSRYVNGYGDGGSMGGYASWWYGDPGYATIELSNSVAEYWPSDTSKALVAHEVGHAISVRCDGMYDDSTQENIEAWATAWAISMGFTDAGNGTSAYGAPPQSLIEAAAACR